MQRRALFKRFREAVEAAGIDIAGIEALSADDVRQMAGVEGRTGTFLENMKRRMASELKLREVQGVAQWIQSRIQTQFPQAETKVRRGGVVEVWLDGIPREVDV